MRLLCLRTSRAVLAIRALAAILVWCLAPQSGWAQGKYPERPIRLIVGYAPGGVADLTARLMAQKLSASMGQQVIIENRPSAGGIIAAETVAKAEPDGYTLLHMNSGNAISVSLFKSLPFDIIRDFASVSRMGSFDIVVFTNKDSPLNDVKDLISTAKASPDKFNIGSINIGSTQHLAAEYFKGVTGLNVPIIPFKTTPALIMAIKSNDIQAAFEVIAPVMPFIKSGDLKALAVSADRRFPGIPSVPTVRESGFPTYQVTAWNAIAVPTKTPRAIIERLNKEINTALAQPDIRKRFQELGMNVHGGTPEELDELLASEIAKWGNIIAAAKIEKQ